MKRNIAIIGQGYVGLPLGYAAWSAGWNVLGVDRDVERVSLLRQGVSPVEDVSNEQVSGMVESGRYRITPQADLLSEASVVVICVPTPLDVKGEPDLTSLKSAVEEVCRQAPAGALIINESTSYPGTVRNLIAKRFTETRPNEKFYFATAPERVDPGNKDWNMSNTPRLVAGLDEASSQLAYEFYSSFCESVVKVSSPEVAELAKLLENSFRQVNIALVSEISRIARTMQVSINEVVDAAGTKPYGFMSFRPRVGVGGHCIPIDPMYLSWFARELGLQTSLIDHAQKINENQPKVVLERMIQILKSNKGKVLIVGLGYKSATSDLRESPSVQLFDLCAEAGFEAFWFDSNQPEFRKTAPQNNSSGMDLIVLAHRDPKFDLSEAKSKKIRILDCTGTLDESDYVFHL